MQWFISTSRKSHILIPIAFLSNIMAMMSFSNWKLNTITNLGTGKTARELVGERAKRRLLKTDPAKVQSALIRQTMKLPSLNENRQPFGQYHWLISVARL